MSRKLTPPQLAKLWGIHPDKVLTWIRNGELRAIDASTIQGGRPRYLIGEDAIAEFERSRSTVIEPAKPTALTRRKPSRQYV